MTALELVGGSFLSVVFQVALERLASTDFKHYFRGKKRIEGLLKKLEITLLSVNQVLEDAEEKQYTNPNVRRWLDELKDAVYVADDLLDEIAYKATHQKLEALSQTTTPTAKVRSFFTSLVNQFDTQIESRIQEVLDNLEFLANKKNEFGLKEDSGGARFRSKILKRLPSTSLVVESDIYGRDGDKEEIIKFLLSDSTDASGKRVSMISVVGMGGLGKTTLAQLVYNDPRMQQQFQLKAWVSVSEDFDVERIIKTILSDLNCSTTGNEDLNQLQLKLKDILIKKKFLLVLDDVWNQDFTLWEALQAPFLYGASGSKAVITTRSKEVASIMQSKVHALQLLEEEDGWNLFAKYAFNDKDAGTNKILEPLGRKIVNKCKGLPLAIKSLGSLVAKELSEQHWSGILESDMWQLPDDKSKIVPALRLSYHYLPSHLKRCFAFCSIYPKDYLISKASIIRLWMAEGLLDCQEGTKCAEELGDEFFNDLLSRSFFQEQFSGFLMHDLVNDLAKSVSGEFCVRIEEGKVPNIPTKARYITYTNGIQFNFGNADHIYQCKLLRMIMNFNIFQNYTGYEVKAGLLSRLKCLRILSLRACANITELVDGISNLKHLRYLDLSWTNIRRLPESICILHNLQTLILSYCSSLAELPQNMHQLISLRYLFLNRSKINKLPDLICELRNLHTLNLEGCECLDELPKDFHKLTNLRNLELIGTNIRGVPEFLGMMGYLQKLPLIHVGKHNGSSIKEFGKLNKLEGRLAISRLENINDVMDAWEAKMSDKNCLEELELEWEEHEDSKNEKSVLEAFKPHVNLKTLSITNYGGSTFVSWFDAPYLPNLVSLKLSGCKYCFSLPPLGQLPFLKSLVVIGLEGIKKIGAEFYGNNSSSAAFKSLEYLGFEEMNEWEDWMHFEGECFLYLQELYLESCPKLTKSLPPYLTSLGSLQIQGCPELEPSLPKSISTEGNWVEECQMQRILLTYPNLKGLSIKDCHKLVSSLNNELSAPKLEELSIGIWGYHELQLPIRSLGLGNCPHLRELRLKNCSELESFHKGGLPSSLIRLEIQNCPKLIACRKEWGLYRLQSLQCFTISGDFENVESFPEESFLPPNLKELSFEGCSKLKLNDKGLLHLTSLNYLRIQDCPSLQCLPEQILPNLLYLYIWGDCPMLKQRYQKENGQDWHKISHIRWVHID